MSGRLEGWEARLGALVEHARDRRYALGEHDCFRFALEAVQALTGVDRWREFAGKYRTRREALRLILQHGRSVDEAAAWLFGTAASPPARARRGDILRYRDLRGEDHFGVCLGARTAVLLEHGLGFPRTSSCVCCWRIG